MRFFLLLSLLSSGIFCVGAEYRSDGFQAKISPKGVLTSLTFRGEKILNLSQLEGACRTPPDKPKGKSVVFRQSDAKNTTEQQTSMLLLAESISSYLRSLSPEARSLFVGRYFYLDSVQEAAAYCGMSISKAKSLLHRTRKGLKVHLEKEGFHL